MLRWLSLSLYFTLMPGSLLSHCWTSTGSDTFWNSDSGYFLCSSWHLIICGISWGPSAGVALPLELFLASPFISRSFFQMLSPLRMININCSCSKSAFLRKCPKSSIGRWTEWGGLLRTWFWTLKTWEYFKGMRYFLSINSKLDTKAIESAKSLSPLEK